MIAKYSGRLCCTYGLQRLTVTIRGWQNHGGNYNIQITLICVAKKYSFFKRLLLCYPSRYIRFCLHSEIHNQICSVSWQINWFLLYFFYSPVCTIYAVRLLQVPPSYLYLISNLSSVTVHFGCSWVAHFHQTKHQNRPRASPSTPFPTMTSLIKTVLLINVKTPWRATVQLLPVTVADKHSLLSQYHDGS
jgi:hypothetical protein